MTRFAHRVDLLGGEGLDADDLEVLRRLPLGDRLADSDMLLGRAVAGLTVNARLRPRGVIGIGLGIVVGGQLAHMAAVARGVERVHRVRPGHRGVRPRTGEMAHAAGGRVEPRPGPHIIGHGQSLQTPAFQRCQKVVDVLPAITCAIRCRFSPSGPRSRTHPCSRPIHAMYSRLPILTGPAGAFRFACANSDVYDCIAKP